MAKGGRRRQWGCREQPGGLPVLSSNSSRASIAAARFAVFFTVVAWFAYVIDQTMRVSRLGFTTGRIVETGAYMLLVTGLTAAAVAHLVARLGALYRAAQHRRDPRVTIDDSFHDRAPAVTVLVPSYREDARVVRQTLLSAALQEYPDLDVVLLIDDPPNPETDVQRALLSEARALPAAIEGLLETQRARAQNALDEFEASSGTTGSATRLELEALADAFSDGAAWFQEQADLADADPDGDHTDAFLAIEVFERMANDLASTSAALAEVINEPGGRVSRRRALQLHRRLVWIFTAKVTSFERKQFASLSHDANKAMNLNSYLHLMGGSYSIETSPGGRVLVNASPESADLVIDDPDYVLTLDADSTLLPEYCLRLVYLMEKPENDKVAVIQTPYSAYRGAATRIERIAGATTDIQHILHQGFAHYGATFWVGANAILRKIALEDIREDVSERGFTVSRYIADRTVIEDTESSIDLRHHGWRLHNYPERLSYSATPVDFGSLVVQRKRWANGGLLILPSLFRLAFRRAEGVARPTFLELFLRGTYLASIAWVSLGLLCLLLYPFDQRLLSWFAVGTALPYFVSVTVDLKRLEYRRSDIVRFYAFNLLLLPVNLVGVGSSIVQAIGGHGVDFARTPKVKGRTASPILFIVAPLLLFLWSAYTLARGIDDGYWGRSVFAGLNAATLFYGFLAFIGLRHAAADVVRGVSEHVYVPAPKQDAPEVVPHWASVLYLGVSVPEDLPRSAPLAVALSAADCAHADTSAVGGWSDVQADAIGVRDGAGRDDGSRSGSDDVREVAV